MPAPFGHQNSRKELQSEPQNTIEAAFQISAPRALRSLMSEPVNKFTFGDDTTVISSWDRFDNYSERSRSYITSQFTGYLSDKASRHIRLDLRIHTEQ